MSVQAIGWALDVRTGKATAKCVLVALANYADEEGVCWPGQATIARQTEMFVDSVQRRLRDLEAKGLIVRERRNGRRGARTTDRYRLQLRPKPQSAALDRSSGKKGDLSRTRNEPKPQVQHERGTKKGSAIRLKHRRYLNNQRPTHRDRGATELEIADRLGPRGWDILGDLQETEVEHLCQRQRRGALDDLAISKLRCPDPP